METGLPIIQVEFFSPDISSAPTIEKALERALERGVDGDRIKTVFRFTDESKKIPKRVAVSQRRDLRVDRDSFLIRLWRSFFNPVLDPGSSTRERKEDKLVSLTKKQLISQIRSGEHEVATENPDYSFRPILPDERHELIERISRSQRAWFFVFSPNADLCTDSPGEVIHYKL